MKEPLFVFGTLRPDTPGVNQAARFGLIPGPSAILKGWALHNLGWFPGIYQRHPEDKVVGMVVQIDSERLKTLDVYESSPSLNTREWVRLSSPDVWAWVYRLSKRPGSHADVISSGDWVEFLKERSGQEAAA